MFSLIITIISIALVTALALATIYYGGSAFKQGGDAAEAARLINEGQQLAGAATIIGATQNASGAPADGFDTIGAAATPTTFSLVEQKGLASAPATWAVDHATKKFTYVVGGASAANVCAAVNAKSNGGSVYSCDVATTTVKFGF